MQKKIKTKFIGTNLELRYIKSSSDIITGVSKKDAHKLEKQGAIGGNGTYRIITPSAVEIDIIVNDSIYTIDIKHFIRNQLQIKNFTRNRISLLKASLPKKIDLLLSNNNTLILDTNSESIQNWLIHLRKLFS